MPEKILVKNFWSIHSGLINFSWSLILIAIMCFW